MNLEPFSLAWWGSILGGLGIFLIGITFLGDGLKKLAGNKLKTIIDKFTSTPLKGMAVGTLATVMIQSSSGTTALAIGLVRAGLMTLPQAVGIIMGANIGTTVTAFMIGLNISSFAPFILAIGAFIYLFANSQKSKHLGEIFFGFGALFFGLTLMENALKPLALLPEFSAFIGGLGDNPLLGVLTGALGTAAIQSSSAFIGVLQSLYSASAEAGVQTFSLAIAIPILFGSNIGTTITAIMASFGGSVQARRAAAVHVLFNVIGSVIFLLLLTPFVGLLSFITAQFQIDPKMQIAIAHIIFNLGTALLLFPFTRLLVNAAMKIVPSPQGIDYVIQVDLSELDRKITDISPATALEIARKQTIAMGILATQSVEMMLRYFDEKNVEARDACVRIESTIDEFDHKIINFLYSMEHAELEESDMNTFAQVLRTVKDIERISDHCENLIEFFDEFFQRNEQIHPDAKQDIIKMLKLAGEMTKTAVSAFELRNPFLANIVNEKENMLDTINKKARDRHVERIVNGLDSGSKYISVVLVDITSNIERIGDHCTNIVENMRAAVSNVR